MTILRMHHVQITIPPGAEAAARAFYCDVLELTEIPKPAALQQRGGFWLQVAGQEVHVSPQDIDRQGNRAHIAYEVDNLQAIRVRLEAAGLTIGESIPLPGYARFECRDPFGNRIEFIQPETP